MRILFASLALAAAGLAVGPVAAADLSITARFTDRQRELIVSYSQQHAAPATESGQQGGKGKKSKSKDKGLPPGIAMNLERGKPLPPGIAKKNLPQDLAASLPPAPKGHEIVVVDGRVLLVEIATQVIRDRLEDVLLR